LKLYKENYNRILIVSNADMPLGETLLEAKRLLLAYIYVYGCTQLIFVARKKKVIYNM
jgi:hypothetical protein